MSFMRLCFIVILLVMIFEIVLGEPPVRWVETTTDVASVYAGPSDGQPPIHMARKKQASWTYVLGSQYRILRCAVS